MFMEKSNEKAIKGASFHKGTPVRVRSRDAILASVDGKGMLEGLPVMPEMFQYCGGIYQIHKCVNRIFVDGIGMYDHRGSYILKDVVCNGSSHTDCQRLCNILWKEEWLESPNLTNENILPELSHTEQKDFPSENLSLCQGQSSVFLNYSKPLSFWDYRQYLHDFRSKTASIRDIFKMLFKTFFRRIFWGAGKYFRSLFRLKQKNPAPSNFSIENGDWVEILSRSEINNTLDKKNKLNGCLFSEAMWQYCGKQFRVLKKIEHMILEQTGALKRLTDTYLLNNNKCDGSSFRGCPRECYWFWKKAWFKKVIR